MKTELYNSRHLEGIAELIVPIQREEFGISITYDDQPDLRDIPGFYQQRAGQFWVALDDGKVVGTIALRDIGSGNAALRKMFVAASHRGREHGTAAKLLAALLDHARHAGLKAVYLGTTEKFVAAHRFYEKNGFALIGVEDLPGEFPLMTVDSRFYRLSL